MTGPDTVVTSDLVQDETLRRMEEAENYNAWLLERSAPYLGRRVLDVGAGIGTFTEALAPGREVTALEPDPAFVAALHSRFAGTPNVRVVAGDVQALDSASLPARFDSIVCFNVLEHIADDNDALRRLRAQLVPGGRLLLLVPAHPRLYGPIDRALTHERRYRKDELRRLVGNAGLTVEVVRHVNPVGALGWLVSARVLRRGDIPAGPLRIFDRVVPLLRMLDRVELPFGLSLWAVARA